MQYVDDTIWFMEHDIEKDENLKMILCAFEQVSGLKINFHKSEIICFGRAKETNNSIRTYLVARPVITRLSILAYRCIIGD